MSPGVLSGVCEWLCSLLSIGESGRGLGGTLVSKLLLRGEGNNQSAHDKAGMGGTFSL